MITRSNISMSRGTDKMRTANAVEQLMSDRTASSAWSLTSLSEKSSNGAVAECN
jgi:hypothetical protein